MSRERFATSSIKVSDGDQRAHLNCVQTWSGRGKRPRWLASALRKRGVALENFLIEDGTSKAATKKSDTKKTLVKKVAKK